MLYKNFNKTLKTIILITLSNCRIIANPNKCLTLCCPCLFENDEIEIENFLKTYKPNKNYKKDENKSGNSLLETTLDNYITAFKDIDKRLGDYFKKDMYKFDKKDNGDYCNSNCLFNFFDEKKTKDILQIGDYCVTFDIEKVGQSCEKFIKDLNEALRIEEDEDIKFLSDEIKNLKIQKNYDDEDYIYLSLDLHIFSIRDNKYIGGIGFKPLRDQKKTPLIFNIAYWLNYNYRGLGIMSVIVHTICKYFFTRIKEIKGYKFCWDKKNSKSAGLAKKTCNFIRTGHEEEYEIKEEDYENKEGIFITKK